MSDEYVTGYNGSVFCKFCYVMGCDGPPTFGPTSLDECSTINEIADRDHQHEPWCKLRDPKARKAV